MNGRSLPSFFLTKKNPAEAGDMNQLINLCRSLGHIVLHSPSLHFGQWIDLGQRRRSARQEVNGAIPGMVRREVSSLGSAKDDGEVQIIVGNVHGKLCEGTFNRSSEQ